MSHSMPITSEDRPCTVLLVEDSLSHAKLTHHALSTASECQFCVRHATNLREALALLAAGPVDVALVDLGLADSDGVATYQALRQSAPSLPIVVFTGRDDEQLAREMLQLGAQDYLLKHETEPKLLVRSLRFAIERQRAADLESRNAQLDDAHTSLTNVVHKLACANEDLAQFTYFASHDLQEPLRKVLWFAEALRDDLGSPLNPETGRDLHHIQDAARRMQSLIAALLTLSRVGHAEMEWRPVALDECVEQALSSLSIRIAETDAQIVREPLPTVLGDASLLAQLYQNLIGNAVKFTGDARPQVRLTAQRQDEDWLLGVHDNGIGLPPRLSQQIFTPFKRLHGRGKYEGTGIGLALCRKVVERHGGRIWVESQPGGGASFQFLLPVRANVAAAAGRSQLPLQRAAPRPACSQPVRVERTGDPHEGNLPALVG